jgi:hypothetical protein
MRQLRGLSLLTVLLGLSGASFAVEPALRASPPEQTATGPASPAASQGLPKACLDVQAGDDLIEKFADRLRETIAASDALSLASTTDSCNLQLHVPGNLLRFETAGGVMVSTVVIVTSSSGHYLSTSVTACQVTDLKPCAVRAVAAAKLALLMSANDGT